MEVWIAWDTAISLARTCPSHGEVPRTPMINRSLWRRTEGMFICTSSFQVECQHQLPPPRSLPLTGPVPWRQPCLPPIDIHFPTRTVQG